MTNQTTKILPSAETRWFFGEEPRQLLDWFSSRFPDVKSEKIRKDWYLSFPTATFAGVRLRSYDTNPPTLNLEFKLLQSDYGNVKLSPDASGTVETWCRWSSVVHMDSKRYMAAVSPGKEWVCVAKDRKLARFRVESGTVEQVDLKSEVPQGCAVELTVLGAKDGARSWTFGFEAFSADPIASLTGILQQTAAYVFRKNAPSGLRAENSISYPTWLNLAFANERGNIHLLDQMEHAAA